MADDAGIDRQPLAGEGAHRRDQADEVLVEALARGLTYAAAGELARVSARTVRRRVSDATFATRVAQRRGERLGEVTGALAGLAERAVAALGDCLDAARPADRIRAANSVLSQLHHFSDAVDLEHRLREVEQTPGDTSGQGEAEG